ncbi:MAG: hypothetical protein OXH83_14240 [Bryobacterales bacterium]|nr:hypothetical protein [Bryobacterales bacterium]
MTKRYGSDVLASVHETALGMAEAGVMSKRTMKAFDEMCLTPVQEMAPERDLRNPDAGEKEPSGGCSEPQCDHGSGEPVGAR